MKKIIFIVILIIGSFIFFINTPVQLPRHENNSIINKKINSKIKYILNFLTENKIKIDKKYLILLYNGFDCPSCIIKALEVIKKYRSEKRNVIIISSASNIHSEFEQANLDIDGVIVINDVHDSMRRILAYPKTPLLFLINKDIITNVVAVTYDDNYTIDMYINLLVN